MIDGYGEIIIDINRGSSSLLSKLCNCDGNVDLMGLGLAALATGVVYILITRDNGDRRKRRKRRHYDWMYDDNLHIYGKL